MAKKRLVVYYSRTGNSKQIGDMISKELRCDVDVIDDLSDRDGIRGWLKGGWDAWKNNPTRIRYSKTPSDYDLIVLGGPVWAGTMAPGVREYLKWNKKRISQIAFFCTYGGSVSKTFDEMQGLSKKPKATLGIKDKDLNSDEDDVKKEVEKEIKKFVRKLKR